MRIPVRPLPAHLLARSLGLGGIERLAAVSTTVEVLPDRLLYRKYEVPAAMWLVTKGKVSAWGAMPGEPFESFGRGIFALTETVAGIPYSTSLISESFCTCERVERRELLELLFEESEACRALLGMLSRGYLDGVERLASQIY